MSDSNDSSGDEAPADRWRRNYEERAERKRKREDEAKLSVAAGRPPEVGPQEDVSTARTTPYKPPVDAAGRDTTGGGAGGGGAGGGAAGGAAAGRAASKKCTQAFSAYFCTREISSQPQFATAKERLENAQKQLARVQEMLTPTFMRCDAEWPEELKRDYDALLEQIQVQKRCMTHNTTAYWENKAHKAKQKIRGDTFTAKTPWEQRKASVLNAAYEIAAICDMEIQKLDTEESKQLLSEDAKCDIQTDPIRNQLATRIEKLMPKVWEQYVTPNLRPDGEADPDAGTEFEGFN